VSHYSIEAPLVAGAGAVYEVSLVEKYIDHDDGSIVVERPLDLTLVSTIVLHFWKLDSDGEWEEIESPELAMEPEDQTIRLGVASVSIPVSYFGAYAGSVKARVGWVDLEGIQQWSEAGYETVEQP
jgi:hypothetical protein